jgi:hypothetical protein
LEKGTHDTKASMMRFVQVIAVILWSGCFTSTTIAQEAVDPVALLQQLQRSLPPCAVSIIAALVEQALMK